MADIISVSLPRGVRGSLDAEAKRQRRSRSYVVADAIREYVAHREREAFAAARDTTLRDGLELAPAERIREVEALSREFARGRAVTQPWTQSFATFADYERWRRG